MRALELFLHVAGISIWLGAGLTFMIFGPASRRMSLESWANTWITLAAVQRALVVPSCLVALLTGVLLSMALASLHAGMTSSLMIMQGCGVLAAGLTLAGSTPLASRMGRLARRSLDNGKVDPAADQVRKALAISASISGVLILVAIYCGVARF